MASSLLLLINVIVFFSSATASFTSRLAKATLVPNTLLGAYSRSKTVATLSLLEQEKLEEAQEALVQSALTLSLLDVGGGAILPVAEEITNYVKSKPEFAGTRKALENYNKVLQDEAAKSASRSVDKGAIRRAKQAFKNALKVDADKFPRVSKVGKAFTKAGKWLKGASVFDVLGPITDTLTIGLNIWGLEMAIRDNNPQGIAAASLSIAAGVVGLGTFIAAIATGSALLGPIGAIAGAFLGIAATLIELFGGPGYDKQAVEEYRTRLRMLRNLRDVCVAQIGRRMEFLDKVGSPYTDVYVNNQAALVVGSGQGELIMADCFDWKTKYWKKKCRITKSSLHLRKYVGPKLTGDDEEDRELRNKTFVGMGRWRGILSPKMPKPASTIFHLAYGYEYGSVGFDFYGKFKEGTSYGGVHVFVNSDFVSEDKLNGIDIDTFVFKNVVQNDVISISEYRNFSHWDNIKISTGNGTDCLNINGMIGEFNSSYENLFTADLGDGLYNTLSFQGISKDREDIKGVFFDSKTHVLKYYHGQHRNTHTLGTVKHVRVFHGSPFNDRVVIYPENFAVFQTSGSNVYEFSYDDLNLGHKWARKYRIIDRSIRPPKINLVSENSNNIDPKLIVLWHKRLIVNSKQWNPVIEIELDTATTGNLFINDANPRPIDFAHISPWGLNFDIINYSIPFPYPRHPFPRFSDRNELLLLKFQTHTATNRADFSVDMKGGKNVVIISNKYFLEPLGVDGEAVTLTLNQWPSQVGSETYEISIENPGEPIVTANHVRFPINIELRNVERIINEYGDQVVYLKSYDDYSPAVPMDLYDKYIEKTRKRFDIRTTEDENEDD